MEFITLSCDPQFQTPRLSENVYLLRVVCKGLRTRGRCGKATLPIRIIETSSNDADIIAVVILRDAASGNEVDRDNLRSGISLKTPTFIINDTMKK